LQQLLQPLLLPLLLRWQLLLLPGPARHSCQRTILQPILRLHASLHFVYKP
jgi:hypothetical protein